MKARGRGRLDILRRRACDEVSAVVGPMHSSGARRALLKGCAANTRDLGAPRAPRGGFTLIEILVALTIAAVALAAGMRALSQAADGAGTLKARTLALWVAQNRLAAIQIAPEENTRGDTQGEAIQAGLPFVWRVRVSTTPNPAFRRVDIVVAEPSMPAYALASLTGYVTGIAP